MKDAMTQLKVMNDKIEKCIRRFLEDKPDGTIVRFGTDEWLIKGTGFS